ncbi:hypothetical protein [Streptomyces sp. Li-HN-5-11]|uniref:hypothetical protein n=1 Tax=Streptomyces sp. Li-HN-5-11 TaxID=3075432 RepID=UPI0037DA484C
MKEAGTASARRTIAAADGSAPGRTACAYVGPAALLHTVVTYTMKPSRRVQVIGVRFSAATTSRTCRMPRPTCERVRRP